MTEVAPRVMPPTAPDRQAVPRLASATESRERTELGIMVGAARTPATVAPEAAEPAPAPELAPAETPAPAAPAPAETPAAPTRDPAETPAPVAPPARATTSTTSTHQGLPAVRQPGPTPKDYSDLLARYHELEESFEALLEHSAALSDELDTQTQRADRAERRLSFARDYTARQAARILELQDGLRRSQAARDASLLVLTETLLDPPAAEPFRRAAATALTELARADRVAPQATAGGST